MKALGRVASTAIALVLVCAVLATAGDVTLVGEVNDNYQLYAEGQLFEVAETPAGNDLVTHYISAKVEVIGTVEEKEDMKIITVLSFRVMPE